MLSIRSTSNNYVLKFLNEEICACVTVSECQLANVDFQQMSDMSWTSKLEFADTLWRNNARNKLTVVSLVQYSSGSDCHIFFNTLENITYNKTKMLIRHVADLVDARMTNVKKKHAISLNKTIACNILEKVVTDN